jgi:predicted methyltransferase
VGSWVERATKLKRDDLVALVQEGKGTADKSTHKKAVKKISIAEEHRQAVEATFERVKAESGTKEDGEALFVLCQEYGKAPDVVEQLSKLSPTQLGSRLAVLFNLIGKDAAQAVMDAVNAEIEDV